VLEADINLRAESKALALELYLKTGFGHAFLYKRIL
jgi:hypothetical protein